MPKVTQSQVTGNRGENLASYLLSQFCLVRHVTSGTDVGIDLYCESITNEQPNNHFWVQVKSSNEEQTSIRLEKEKLLYWWRQPIPVFIFLVRVANSHSAEINVNVVNLTEHLISGVGIEGDSKTFMADFKIDSATSLSEFINRGVPRSIARQWLSHGMIVPSKPGISIEYFRHYPSDGCRKFSTMILKNIGRTASMLLRDIIDADQDPEAFTDARIRLEQILECFQDYGNWDMHYYRGMSKLLRGDLTNTKDSLLKALQCIEGDKLVDQNQWQTVKEEIRRHITEIDAQNAVS